MSEYKIAVMGDSFLDKYSFYDSYRTSPEADVPVIINQNAKYFPGGASLVSCVIAEKNIEVDLYTRLGNSKESNIISEFLYDRNVNIFDYSTNFKTILKDRVIVNNKYFLRIDDEKITSLENPSQLIHDFTKHHEHYDFVVLSDYSKGFFSDTVSKFICSLNIKDKTILDPKPGSKLEMRNWAFLKPNFDEGILISSKNKPSEIIKEINKSHNTSTILTKGAEGVFYQNHQSKKIEHIKPKKFDEVVDTSGSGDIFLGNFVSSYLITNDIKQSIVCATEATQKPLSRYGYW